MKSAKENISPIVTIEYDTRAHAAYIRLKAGRVVKTLEKSEHFLLDLGKDGDLIGIEILEANRVSAKNCKAFFATIGREYKHSLLGRFQPSLVPQLFAA